MTLASAALSIINQDRMRLSYLRCCAFSVGPSSFTWDTDELGFRSFADFRRVALPFNVRREWDFMMPVMWILYCSAFTFRDAASTSYTMCITEEDLSRRVTDSVVFFSFILYNRSI